MSWLEVGHKFHVAIDETGKTYPARIQRHGARIDPVSQSLKLVGVLDGQFADRIAGMSGKIELAPPAGQQEMTGPTFPVSPLAPDQPP